MTSPISTCRKCLNDYDTADLNEFMECYVCDHECDHNCQNPCPIKAEQESN